MKILWFINILSYNIRSKNVQKAIRVIYYTILWCQIYHDRTSCVCPVRVLQNSNIINLNIFISLKNLHITYQCDQSKSNKVKDSIIKWLGWLLILSLEPTNCTCYSVYTLWCVHVRILLRNFFTLTDCSIREFYGIVKTKSHSTYYKFWKTLWYPFDIVCSWNFVK